MTKQELEEIEKRLEVARLDGDLVASLKDAEALLNYVYELQDVINSVIDTEAELYD